MTTRAPRHERASFLAPRLSGRPGGDAACHSASRRQKRWRRAGCRAGRSSRPSGTASTRDGIVTVNIIRAEMGQHVGTALARILADELEADWARCGSTRSTPIQVGPDGHRRQQVGMADLSRIQPRGRGRADRADRGGRKAARRSGAAMLGAQRRGRGRQIDPSPMPRSSGMATCAAPLHRDELAQMPIKPASERRLIGRKRRRDRHSREDERHGALRNRATVEAWSTRGQKFRPTRNGATVALDRRFRGQEGQGLYRKPRARGPVQYGSGLGDGVRELLSGRDPRRRPCQGRVGGGRRRKGFRAGRPRSWRKADR